METTTPNPTQAIITLPQFRQSEAKRISLSLANILYHALLSDEAIEAIGYEALADGFCILENTINAIPVCTD